MEGIINITTKEDNALNDLRTCLFILDKGGIEVPNLVINGKSFAIDDLVDLIGIALNQTTTDRDRAGSYCLDGLDYEITADGDIVVNL